MKKAIFAVIGIFISWEILDFLMHEVILGTAYEATAGIWRPMEEMKMGLNFLVVFISVLVFVMIYGWLVGNKSTARGIWFGLLWGIGWGISFGYGTYSVLPIPYYMALVWFLGTVVEGIVGGLIAGLLIKEKPAAAA